MTNNYSQQRNKGNGSVQQQGQSNINVQQQGQGNIFAEQLLVITPPIKLTESEIYTLLQIVLSTTNIPDNADFNNAPPAGFRKKLHYNNAVRYKLHFDTFSDEQFKVSQVIEDFPDSEPIIKKLRTLFVNNANFEDGEMVVGDGDEQLEKIRLKLRDAIDHDPRYDQEKGITEEKIDSFTYALLAYGVMKCKVLINPDEKGDGDYAST